jgi:hypothetical protein
LHHPAPPISHSFSVAVGVHGYLDVKANTILLNSTTGKVQGLVQTRDKEKTAKRSKEKPGEDGIRATLGTKRKNPTPSTGDHGVDLTVPTDDSHKFLFLLEAAIIEAKKQNPKKVIVMVIDGSQVHTVECDDYTRPAQMTIEQLKTELTEMDLWDDSTMNVKSQAATNLKTARQVRSRCQISLISSINHRSSLIRHGQRKSGCRLSFLV